MNDLQIIEDRPSCQQLRVREANSAADRRIIFAGQARLLAARADAELPIDVRSLLNLIRAYRDLVAA
jgi:hypothetical protein